MVNKFLSFFTHLIKKFTNCKLKVHNSKISYFNVVNVWMHDFDDDKEESNKVVSKDKHCFKINTRLFQQTKSCFKINLTSRIASKQSV